MTYSEKELIEELKRVSEEYCDGKCPRQKDMKEYGNISHDTYSYRFGSWSNSVKQIGFTIKSNNNTRKTTKQMKSRLSSIPPSNFKKYNFPLKKNCKRLTGISGSTYTNRFGSWKKALDECGYKSRENRTSENKIDKKRIIKEIKIISEEKLSM